MAQNEYLETLSNYLFWDMDIDSLDAQNNARQLIQRVLEYGELSDWRQTRRYYGLDRVVSECKAMRSLAPTALSFICTISHTKKEDYRCYHFAQSFPTPWNS